MNYQITMANGVTTNPISHIKSLRLDKIRNGVQAVGVPPQVGDLICAYGDEKGIYDLIPCTKIVEVADATKPL